MPAGPQSLLCMAMFLMSFADRFEDFALSLSRHSPYTSCPKGIRLCARTRRLSFVPSVHGSLLARKLERYGFAVRRGVDQYQHVAFDDIFVDLL